ncbi:MAG: DUF1566 domain-containing protein [Oceanihabitans sp.]
MRIIICFLVVVFNVVIGYSQAPEQISYQSIIRDASGDLVQNQNVGIQISILQGSDTGTLVYVETHMVTTNENGLATLSIGTGTTSGDLATINWETGPYYIKSETDPQGGTNYTIAGTSQLLSVPYALYAKTSGNNSSCGLSIGDTYQGGIVFYLDPSGCHGLICAPMDQSTGAAWGNFYHETSVANGTGLFEGIYNTKAIVWESDGTVTAASICQDLSLSGYEDWYLPSIYELNLMYLNIGQGNSLGLGDVGGFSSYYWSSSDVNSQYAWYQNFTFGGQTRRVKSAVHPVRAIRRF